MKSGNRGSNAKNVKNTKSVKSSEKESTQGCPKGGKCQTRDCR